MLNVNIVEMYKNCRDHGSDRAVMTLNKGLRNSVFLYFFCSFFFEFYFPMVEDISFFFTLWLRTFVISAGTSSVLTSIREIYIFPFRVLFLFVENDRKDFMKTKEMHTSVNLKKSNTLFFFLFLHNYVFNGTN